jgi:hypothetical protein
MYRHFVNLLRANAVFKTHIRGRQFKKLAYRFCRLQSRLWLPHMLLLFLVWVKVSTEASKSCESQVAVHALCANEADVKIGYMAAVAVTGMCCRFVQKYC